MQMWYNPTRILKVRDFCRRMLMSLLDIPSQSELTEKDQDRIKVWLVNSAQDMGFHKYITARDRSFAQTMIGLDIEDPAQRRFYHELSGRRIELARLMQRAEKIIHERDKARREDRRPTRARK